MSDPPKIPHHKPHLVIWFYKCYSCLNGGFVGWVACHIFCRMWHFVIFFFFVEKEDLHRKISYEVCRVRRIVRVPLISLKAIRFIVCFVLRLREKPEALRFVASLVLKPFMKKIIIKFCYRECTQILDVCKNTRTKFYTINT